MVTLPDITKGQMIRNTAQNLILHAACAIDPKVVSWQAPEGNPGAVHMGARKSWTWGSAQHTAS